MRDFPKRHRRTISLGSGLQWCFSFDSDLSCCLNGSSTQRTRVAARAPAAAHAQFVEMDADNPFKCPMQTHTEYLTITSGTMDASQKYQHSTSNRAVLSFCYPAAFLIQGHTK